MGQTGWTGVALLFPALLCAQKEATTTPEGAAGPGGHAAVHGVVLNTASGEPLPRALVRMTGEGSAGMLTDGEGRFELADIPTGPEQFEIIKPGFLDATAEAAAAAGSDARSFAHTVIVTGETPDILFRMEPANAVHGQVQLSTEDSAEGIEITLLRQTVESGRFAWQVDSTTRTNADGTYRFGGLADGIYAIYSAPAMDSEPSAGPDGYPQPMRDGYPSRFYPDANDLAGAAKLRLLGGEQEEANFSLMLETFHPVRALVIPPNDATGQQFRPDRPGTTLSAVVTDSQGHQLPYLAQYDQATHRVQAMLPDGSYSLVVTAGRPTLLARRGGFARSGREEGPYTGAVEFSVAGHAVPNLRVALTNAARSSVQVNLARTGTTATRAGSNGEVADSIFLTMSQSGGWIGDGMVSTFATGSYNGPLSTSFAAPGTYWIHLNLPDRRVCEGSLTAGGTNLAREPLTVTISGSPAPLTLNLRDDCAKLTLTLPGTAAGSGAGEEPFYTVYVVPDFDSTEDVTTQTLRPSSGGSVTLDGLTPGNYHVYVFGKPVALAYHERAALDGLPMGQTIELAPGQEASLLLEAPKP